MSRKGLIENPRPVASFHAADVMKQSNTVCLVTGELGVLRYGDDLVGVTRITIAFVGFTCSMICYIVESDLMVWDERSGTEIYTERTDVRRLHALCTCPNQWRPTAHMNILRTEPSASSSSRKKVCWGGADLELTLDVVTRSTADSFGLAQTFSLCDHPKLDEQHV